MALARRAKETSRQDRSTVITKPDGTTQVVFKYRRKKRFGKSITSRAPALVLQVLRRKCAQYGLGFFLTDTRKMKASQYDHTSGTCTKHSFNDRELTLSDGTKVQRDLYSAFLHRHADGKLEYPDREACTKDFPSFLKMQDALVRKMKADGVSMKHCFGF